MVNLVDLIKFFESIKARGDVHVMGDGEQRYFLFTTGDAGSGPVHFPRCWDQHSL